MIDHQFVTPSPQPSPQMGRGSRPRSWHDWASLSSESAVVGAIILALAMPVACALAQPAPSASESAACDRAGFRVVIDVGHSAEVYGARSARGVTEYEFNLRLARRIDQALAEAGFARRHLMITPGGPQNLPQRSIKANSFKADLFVSIHHDSVQDHYLQRWVHDGRSRLYSDRFRGWSLFVSHDNARRAASLRFAAMLADELLGRGLTFTTHHAEDIQGERR